MNDFFSPRSNAVLTSQLPTALSFHLQQLLLQGKFDEPVTRNRYVARARALPLLAANQAYTTSIPAEDQRGFAAPLNLSTLDLRGMGLIAHGFSPRDKKGLSLPISPIQHMLLTTFEATPRPLSFSMNGYSASDFVAYIYQDVAERFINTPAVRSPLFTNKKRKEIKQWLVDTVPRKQNSPQRHIRRRLMALFNRTNQQINSLFLDREISPEMLLLFRKLMERDDNLGYMQGQLRDFKLIRNDLNLLGEYITLRHLIMTGDVERYDAYLRVDCPATISDFESVSIDKPRSSNKKKKK